MLHVNIFELFTFPSKENGFNLVTQKLVKKFKKSTSKAHINRF